MKRLIQRYLLTFNNAVHQAPAPQPTAETDDSNRQRELITWLEDALKKTKNERSPDAAKTSTEVIGQSWSFLDSSEEFGPSFLISFSVF